MGGSRPRPHGPDIGRGERRDRADSAEAQRRGGDLAPSLPVPVQAGRPSPGQVAYGPDVGAGIGRDAGGTAHA